MDGTQLRSINISLPEIDEKFTGALILQLAESVVSSSLNNLTLPECLKSNGINRVNIDLSKEFERDEALEKVKDIVDAIADELKDDPLVVAILDGTTLQLFLEDEDDFAMLAENIFTDLDTEDKGKISRNEVKNALIQMGVELGIPPFSEFPRLYDILKKHGAEGEEELGQAQFAQVLQPILQELAEALAEKHVVVIQRIKIINGSKLRKLLADEKQLNDVIEKIFPEKHDRKDEQKRTDMIRGVLENNCEELGLPPTKNDEAVVLLYDMIFADVVKGNNGATSDKDELVVLVKEILEKFAEQLEASPVFHDLDN